MKNIITFFRDEDGFSAKDFLMVVFTVAYIVQQVFLLAASFLWEMNDYTMEIADNLNVTFIAIVCGVFSVNAAEVLGSRRSARRK